MKILILSYHSLPMDVIASYRAMAYLHHFQVHGLQPTLLTHHWDGTSSGGVTVEQTQSGSIIRVPIKRKTINQIVARIEQIPVINKVAILLRWTLGILDPKPDDWNSYLSLRAFSIQHLKEHHYDVLLGIFSPHHHLKLCYELHRRFGIPYVLDFRDLWHNRVIHRHYHPDLTERLQDAFTRYYWKRWLSRALFFSITSQEWMNKLREFTSTRGIVIHNGFDPELFEGSAIGKDPADEFVVLHAGTLYAHQRLDIFLKGCRLFVENEKPDRLQVRFLGGDRHGPPNLLSGYMHEPKKYIENFLNTSFCQVTRRVPKVEVANQVSQSQLLLFPGLPDAPGTHLGKIFDYLGSGRNILLVPDDQSVVGELIRETNTGFIANTPEEVYQVLVSCYNEWIEHGSLRYQGQQEKISQYTRGSQVRKMAEAIQAFL